MKSSKPDVPKQTRRIRLLFVFLAVLFLLLPKQLQSSSETALKGSYSHSQSQLLIIQGNALIARNVLLQNSPESQSILAVITAYNAVPEQTDEEPCIAASGLNVCKYPERVIACPAWLAFDTKIRIGNEVYFCQDRMSAKRRYSKNPAYFDILKPTIQESREWGKRELIIYIY